MPHAYLILLMKGRKTVEKVSQRTCCCLTMNTWELGRMGRAALAGATTSAEVVRKYLED